MSDFDAQKVHISPDHFLYEGGYTEVRECMTCHLVQEEKPELNGICKICGHKGHHKYAAKWVPLFKWWNVRTWGRGYWQRLPQSIMGNL